MDVIKERLQVQVARGGDIQYKGGADAFVKIWRTEGPLGYYRGYAATLMSFGPFSALYFMFYEQLKYFSAHVSGSQSLPMPFLIASSASAGALASFLTSPLDLAKLRLQVQRGQGTSGSNEGTAYRGVADCLLRAYQRGGLRGLFRGAGARVLHFVPATSTFDEDAHIQILRPHGNSLSIAFFMLSSCNDDELRNSTGILSQGHHGE